MATTPKKSGPKKPVTEQPTRKQVLAPKVVVKKTAAKKKAATRKVLSKKAQHTVATKRSTARSGLISRSEEFSLTTWILIGVWLVLIAIFVGTILGRNS